MRPPTRPLPGDVNWGQAAEYGWTGSPDPNVVTRATQTGAPNLEGVGDYWGADTGGFGGSIAPYSGPSGDLLQSQSTEDLGVMSSSMTSKIRQALVDLGLTDVSQLDEGARKYVDDPTLAAAKANKYSLYQQIADASAKATAQSRAELAARGMLGSGQLTKSAQDIIKQGEEKRYAGTRTFSGSVGELLSAYAQRQREWAQRIAEARFAEAQYRTAARASGGPIDNGAGLAGRPGEWADLPVKEGWNPNRNVDARYDMSGATRQSDGTFIGPQGQRYDENGRVI